MLIQRTRFLTALKNLTGIRGPASLDLLQQAQGSFDLGAYDPLVDDEVAYWLGPSLFIGAAAGNFSTITVRFPSTQTGAVRASVDGMIIRPATGGATAYNFGLTVNPGAGATTGCALRNNFLSQRGAALGLSNQFNALNMVTNNTSAASLFGAPAAPLTIDLAAGNTDSVVTEPFPFIIQPGWAFTLESGVVNQQVYAGFWGRFLGDQQ